MGLGAVSSDPVEHTDVLCPALRSGSQSAETGDSSSPLSPPSSARAFCTIFDVLRVIVREMTLRHFLPSLLPLFTASSAVMASGTLSSRLNSFSDTTGEVGLCFMKSLKLLDLCRVSFFFCTCSFSEALEGLRLSIFFFFDGPQISLDNKTPVFDP